MRLALVVSLILLGFAPPAFAADVQQPAKSSPLRTTLLDAARPTFETETGGPVEFVVTTLNVLGKWAYGNVKLQRPGGAPMTGAPRNTPRPTRRACSTPRTICFCFSETPEGWSLVEFAVGPDGRGVGMVARSAQASGRTVRGGVAASAQSWRLLVRQLKFDTAVLSQADLVHAGFESAGTRRSLQQRGSRRGRRG